MTDSIIQTLEKDISFVANFVTGLLPVLQIFNPALSLEAQVATNLVKAILPAASDAVHAATLQETIAAIAHSPELTNHVLEQFGIKPGSLTKALNTANAVSDAVGNETSVLSTGELPKTPLHPAEEPGGNS